MLQPSKRDLFLLASISSYNFKICKTETSLIVFDCGRCYVWQERKLLLFRKKVPVTSINHITSQINIIQISLWENTTLTCFLWLMFLFPLAFKCFPLVMPPSFKLSDPWSTLSVIVLPFYYYKKIKATKTYTNLEVDCICCNSVLHKKAAR